MYRTRIKICGITSVTDAIDAVQAGADALGLVFWSSSKRAVDIEQAKAICEAVPAFVTVVGLFVDATETEVQSVLTQVPITLLQFHGSEPEHYCQSFSLPYMKALRMKPGLNVSGAIEQYSSAASILLDAYQKGVPGGTGESFDWALIPVAHRQRIVLAGGLTPQNIQQAVQQVRPYAVDVSGGVEVSPGKKQTKAVRDFIRAVAMADQSAVTH
ncbi:phosphoribosylanthranilate isomerase [bacterium]|nr:phosphoribosylanthranilate isomerase [bacterium]